MSKKRSVHLSNEALAALKVISDERGYSVNQSINVAIINFGKYISYMNNLKELIDGFINRMGFQVTPYYPDGELDIISQLGKKSRKLHDIEKLEKYARKRNP